MRPAVLRILCVLAVLCGAALGAVRAQTVITNHRHYRMVDGLPADKVTSLYEAPDGALWAGTNGGLCRFDGTAFTSFPIDTAAVPVAAVTALHSPNDTLLYIGTLRGLAVYDLHSRRFANGRIRSTVLRAGTGQEVVGIAPLPHGDALVVAGGYLAVLDRQGGTRRIRRAVEDLNAFINIFAPPCFLNADSTAMLVFTQQLGFCALDLRTLELRPTDGRNGERPNAGPPNDPPVYAYRLPGEGRFLFGSYWGEHVYADPARGDRVRFPPPPGQPGGIPAHPTRVVQDPTDPSVHWVATRHGLRRFDEGDRSFVTYTVSSSTSDAVTTNLFNDLLIDRHGQKWLASNGGLIKLSRLTWMFQDLGFEALPGAAAMAFGKTMADGDGRLWVATFDRGLYRVGPDRKAEALPTWRSMLTSGGHITFDLRPIDGVPHAATDRGIVRYNAATGRFEDTGLVPDSLLREDASAVLVHRDTRGEWWCSVGRGGGLVRVRPDGRRTVYDHYFEKPGSPLHLPIRYPTVLVEDRQGDLWMGLARREGLLVHWRRQAERFDTVTIDLGTVRLQQVAITDMLFDGTGDLWVTTYSHGVLRRDARTGGWTRYGVREGLRSNDATAAALDGSGNLWVGTANGIAVLPKGTGRFRAYSIEDGMPHAPVSWLGFPHGDRSHRLVVTGDGYVQAVDVRALLQPRAPLRVHIDRIDVEGEALAVPGTDRFSHDRSHFTFHFNAVNLVDGPDDRYAYRLGGLEDAWIDAQGRRSANYANVPPGRYVFQVKVRNAGTGWSEPAAFAFVVEEPWWRRWWFIALVAFTVTAVVYTIYRVRINRLLELERVRSGISRDLHDDIGSTLSSINILAHATRSRLKEADPGKVEESLGKIGERTQRMLDSMNDIIWSIKPENDALPNVLARMREYASSTLEARGIAHTIDFPENTAHVQLPLALKNNLYLVFKEAVNNLAKYSGATSAGITLSVKDRMLRLVVEDNGRGFDPSALQRGNGLANMRRRAEECGAHFAVHSSPGAGTRVELVVPRLP